MSRSIMKLITHLLTIFIIVVGPHSTAFTPTSKSASPLTKHHSQNPSIQNFEDALYLERFKRRLISQPQQTPKEIISSLLLALNSPHYPNENRGYELLYRSSTEKWQYVLRSSVGAKNHTEEELIYSALANSMEREAQQFGILVGMGIDDGSLSTNDTNNMSTTLTEEYTIEFPYDTLDYHDGTAWVEVRLRNKQNDALLVVMGWSLRQNVRGKWLVDGIDWQDFREKYRPGVGREEWERICG